MDLQSAFVCVLVFVVSGAILLIVSMFGMREKSYEEALAEQRQLTGGLLASRPKSKDKKQKKTGKKVKEKLLLTAGTQDSDEMESREEEPQAVTIATPKTHVEFEEPTIVVDPPTTNNKKRPKKEKIKPILLNKEKMPVVEAVNKTGVVNHFEKTHPKDDFEMLHIKQESIAVVKQEKAEGKGNNNKTKGKETAAVEQQPRSVKVSKEKKPPTPTAEETAAIAVVQETVALQPPSVVPSNNNGAQVTSVKDKKKKKSEFNTLQQMSASDKHAVNVSLLVPLVRKSELSRSEIQILIDLLLNKQHEAPTVLDEWSEGRADPVQKLKRQLADKERQLAEEQEALGSAQAKLREIRSEFNAERSKLLQNYRGLEDTVQAKHGELQTVAGRLHSQNQKMQQIQAQMNEEALAVHKLRQELNSMQLQRQQLDLHLNQKQEAESSFQSQISQLRSELLEQQNLNSQLNMDLMNLRETNHAEKEMLRERVLQVELETVQYKNELNQRDIVQHQFEEFRKRMQQQIKNLEVEKAHLEAANGAASEGRSKEIELLNAQNELSSARSQLQQIEAQYTLEISEIKKLLSNTEDEVKIQKEKNDELRKKNWKVMEALNIAQVQRNLQTVSVVDDDASLKKIEQEEQEKSRKFIQRLFPHIPISKSENWMTGAEEAVEKYVEELQKRETKEKNSAVDVARLQTQIVHYRTIIDDTEGVLNKLQTHVEKAEINWRKEIQAKDEELETLKEQNKLQEVCTKCRKSINHSPSEDHGVNFAFSCIEKSLPVITQELHNKISELKEKLLIEEHARQELEGQIESLRKSSPKGNLANFEKIVEEKTRLADELNTEQKRSQDLAQEIFRLRAAANDSLNDVASVAVKLAQNHTSNGTVPETVDLPNSASSSSVSPTSTKPRNKKNKRKATVNN